jgi:hypothetical protein
MLNLSVIFCISYLYNLVLVQRLVAPYILHFAHSWLCFKILGASSRGDYLVDACTGGLLPNIPIEAIVHHTQTSINCNNAKHILYIVGWYVICRGIWGADSSIAKWCRSPMQLKMDMLST